MKDSLKATLVQFAPAWLEGNRNAGRMREFAAREADSGAELVIFPETANTGYIPPLALGDPLEFPGGSGISQFYQQYAAAAETVPGPTTEVLAAVAGEYGIYIVAGILERHPAITAALFDAAVLIGPQGLIAVQRKLHTTLNEQIFFSKGESLQVHATGLGNIGLIVGHDAWLPEVPRLLALRGAEIICHVSLGTEAIDPEMMRDLAAVRARENTVYFLACNCASNGGYDMPARSTIASPTGSVLASADSGEEAIVRAGLAHEELLRARGRFGVLRDRRPELYSAVCAPGAPDSGVIRQG